MLFDLHLTATTQLKSFSETCPPPRRALGDDRSSQGCPQSLGGHRGWPHLYDVGLSTLVGTLFSLLSFLQLFRLFSGPLHPSMRTLILWFLHCCCEYTDIFPFSSFIIYSPNYFPDIFSIYLFKAYYLEVTDIFLHFSH